ncbi:MAG: long-chain fatty acid--CoA ligase [Chitinophagales bacterium]|nr:long-chain fatty acid--CoA ligase [Chitinophagales bacterium]MDW8273410.1 long-chain fatty acid--CoA ligase [Chitinophagales bacterium]
MSDFTRLFDIIPYQLSKFPKEDCFAAKENGNWRKYSTKEVLETANKLSIAMLNSGINPGDKVVIVSNNRPEWNITDLGLSQVGIITVPVYPTISENEYRYIFNDAGVKAVFVSDANLFTKISSIKPDVPTLEFIVSFDQVPGCTHFSDFLKKGENGDFSRIKEISSTIKPNDLATIIYTSGTTGNPKGVMLSHNNVVSNVKAVLPLLPLTPDKRVLSFLPLCHIFERMVVYVYNACGVSVYYAESLDTIAANLKEVKPNFFTSVPRLLEKVYLKLEAAGANLTGFKKKLYQAALEFANQYDPDKQLGLIDKIKYKLFDKLIYSKWREALGGNCEGICTGAAALQPRLARVFTCAGILICEGYGQTETSPVISVNPFDKNLVRFGTVGNVIDGVEVKLDHREGMREGEGEILVKGPNVMMGYYNKPELTAEAFADGWLKTGDVGAFVEYKGRKYLKITDRVKELFKTSGGKYIAPQVLENKMKESPYIEQIMAVGEGKNFVTALIVPNFANLKEWCEKNGIKVSSNAEISRSPEVYNLIKADVERLNKNFGQWETIKKFELIPHEWTIEGGELTPTMKVKRKFVHEKYKDLIEKMYMN